jgi:phosphoglycerol transferase MdoB-like AlkP superfamily enzyme
MKTLVYRFRSSLAWRPALIGLLLVSVFTATRLFLALYEGFSPVPLKFWPGIFLKGLGFDLAALLLFAGPVCLYEAATTGEGRSKAGLWARAAAFCGMIFFILFIPAAEITFWTEFSTRLNFIAVDYLLYTHEVIGNIYQSYPINWIFAGIGVVAALITWRLLPFLRAARTPRPSKAARALCLLLAFALPAGIYALIDINMADGSGNVYADELSGNGVLSFFAALKQNELDYEKFYRTIPQPEADAVLKRLDVERVPLSAAIQADMYDEADDALPLARRPRNIILISVESLSASFLGAYGSKDGLTPNLDRLARAGLKFERFFATGTRTVRGLEALSLGVPPIPGQSVVRRPGNEHLSTLGGLLGRQGVSTFFIYGGHGYFDNMNGYFRGNDYRVIDRGDFPSASVVFENIWGAADEVLYDNALEALDLEAAAGRPFFAHIMTTSNHRPYTYPDGRIDIPSPGGRRGAVKYTDYAIGKFIDDAKRKAWFRDTVFMVTADHCASVAGKTKLPVEKYRIPLIIYGPGIVRPGVYTQVVSQIDLTPTIVEFLGRKGDAHFFGRCLFEDGPNPARAFISNYQVLGYLRRDILTVLLPQKRVASYRIDPVTHAQTPAPVDPELLKEAIAYYQTAARAFKSGAMTLTR